jgi:hypothetical protein
MADNQDAQKQSTHANLIQMFRKRRNSSEKSPLADGIVDTPIEEQPATSEACCLRGLAADFDICCLLGRTSRFAAIRVHDNQQAWPRLA